MNNTDIKKAAKKNGRTDKAPRGAEVRKDFDEIFRSFVKSVYGLAFIYIKKPEDTATVTEEVFIKLLLSKKELSGDSERKNWIFRTAHDTIMDYFRIKMRKKIRPQDMKKLSLPFNPDAVLNSILMLPDKLKTALYLSYAEGMTADEIAKATSSLKGRVETKLAKCEEIISEDSKHSGSKLSYDERVKASLRIITLPPAAEEHIYYEIKRKFQDKAFISKARISYKKHILDRYIPYIAAFCIAVVVYAFFAVENGWITGQKFKESTALAEEYGYTYEGEDKTLTEVLEYYGVTPLPTKASDESSKAAEPEKHSLTKLNGESFEISDFDGDPFELWDKLADAGAIPDGLKLVSYSVDSSDPQKEVLVLDVSEEIKTLEDVSAFTELTSRNFLTVFNYASVRFTCGGEEIA